MGEKENKEQIQDLTSRITYIEEAFVNKSASIDQMVEAWRMEQKIHLQGMQTDVYFQFGNYLRSKLIDFIF